MDVGLVLIVGFALNGIASTALTLIGWFWVFKWQAKWMDAANKARDDEARAAADVRCGEIYRSEIHRRAMGWAVPKPNQWRTDAPPVGVPIIVDHPGDGIAVRTLYSTQPEVMLTVTRWLEVPK